MKRLATLIVAAALVSSTAAFSIEPSHYGPYGNPEEPATRPYKAFWRGLKAFGFQIRNSIDEGHHKAGPYGDVMIFRGVRRGVVEIGAGTYMGMAGSYPLPVKQTHPANIAIEQDRRVAALADLPTTVAIFGLAGTGSVGMVFGPAAVTVAQSEVDRAGMSPEEREEIAAIAAQTRAQNWPASAADRNQPRPAGLKFAGKMREEAKLEKSKDEPLAENPYTGDMIEKARRGRIANKK